MDQGLNSIQEQEAFNAAGRDIMAEILASFPEFEETFSAHLSYWEGDSPIPFLDINEFAWFFINNLVDCEDSGGVRQAFQLMESIFLRGNEFDRNLIAFNFLKDVQNILSGRSEAMLWVIALLPPTLKEIWLEVDRYWGDCKSLIEVISAEANENNGERITWAQFLNRLGVQ